MESGRPAKAAEDAALILRLCVLNWVGLYPAFVSIDWRVRSSLDLVSGWPARKQNRGLVCRWELGRAASYVDRAATGQSSLQVVPILMVTPSACWSVFERFR